MWNARPADEACRGVIILAEPGEAEEYSTIITEALTECEASRRSLQRLDNTQIMTEALVR